MHPSHHIGLRHGHVKSKNYLMQRDSHFTHFKLLCSGTLTGSMCASPAQVPVGLPQQCDTTLADAGIWSPSIQLRSSA
jgi:hypothetical protein